MKQGLLFCILVGFIFAQSATNGRVYPFVSYTNNTVGAVTYSPVSGTYTTLQTVSISVGTNAGYVGGAIVCYTTDGTSPTATYSVAGWACGGTSTLYTTALTSFGTTGGETLNATAFYYGMAQSTASGVYVYNPYLYYGPGCSGVSSNSTCQNNSGSTSQTGLSTFIIGTNTNMTMGTDMNGYQVNACGVYFSAVDGTNKLFQCAIYTPGSGTISKVTNCTSTAGTTATTGGWTENTNFTSCTLSASTAYFIGIEVNGSGTGYYYHSATTPSNSSGKTYGTWPTSFAPANGQQYSIYLRVTPQ